MKLLSSLLPIAAMAGIQYMSSGSVNPATTSQLAQSFLESGKKGNQKFGRSPAPIQPRTASQLASGSRAATASTPQLQPIQRLMQSDPRLDSAMMNLVQNARNQQVIDMFSKYANVNFTAKGGQPKTRMTEV
jgi:hypothetical protein